MLLLLLPMLLLLLSVANKWGASRHDGASYFVQRLCRCGCYNNPARGNVDVEAADERQRTHE